MQCAPAHKRSRQRTDSKSAPAARVPTLHKAVPVPPVPTLHEPVLPEPTLLDSTSAPTARVPKLHKSVPVPPVTTFHESVLPEPTMLEPSSPLLSRSSKNDNCNSIPHFLGKKDNHEINVSLRSGSEFNLISESAVVDLVCDVFVDDYCEQVAEELECGVIGVTEFHLSCNGLGLYFEGIVVRDLDVDIVGGMPFIEDNDILIRPARRLVTFSDSSTFHYDVCSPLPVPSPSAGIHSPSPSETERWTDDNLKLSANITEFEGSQSTVSESVGSPSPEPVDSPSPEPVDSPSPEPVDSPIPGPVDIPSPEPVNSPSPEPVGSHSPEPVGTHSPEPLGSHSREPGGSHSPEPVDSPSTEPVGSHSPAQVGNHSPSPVTSHGPEPVGDHSPTPVLAVESLGPEPVGSLSLEPVGNTPESFDSYGLEPVRSYSPVSVCSPGPDPVGGHSPDPVDSHGPEPIDNRPVVVGSPSREPGDSHSPVLADRHGPEPDIHSPESVSRQNPKPLGGHSSEHSIEQAHTLNAVSTGIPKMFYNHQTQSVICEHFQEFDRMSSFSSTVVESRYSPACEPHRASAGYAYAPTSVLPPYNTCPIVCKDGNPNIEDSASVLDDDSTDDVHNCLSVDLTLPHDRGCIGIPGTGCTCDGSSLMPDCGPSSAADHCFVNLKPNVGGPTEVDVHSLDRSSDVSNSLVDHASCGLLTYRSVQHDEGGPPHTDDDDPCCDDSLVADHLLIAPDGVLNIDGDRSTSLAVILLVNDDRALADYDTALKNLPPPARPPDDALEIHPPLAPSDDVSTLDGHGRPPHHHPHDHDSWTDCHSPFGLLACNLGNSDNALSTTDHGPPLPPG